MVITLDVELQSILRFGWDYVRSHPELVDQIFANFTSGHLATLYGQKEIDSIKTWIKDNDVYVVQSWSLNPERMPSISIHLAQSAESIETAGMADHGGIYETSRSPTTIVETFTPKTFSTSTGVMTTRSTVDLSKIRPGHILKDAKGELFVIESPITDTSFALNIENGSDISLNGVTIQDSVTVTRAKRGTAYFNEQVDLGIHGHSDSNVVLWMYYIIQWVLFRFKPIMENRGVDLQTYTASEFNRESKYLGEQVFSRWMRVSGKTSIDWKEDPYPDLEIAYRDFKANTSTTEVDLKLDIDT